jgi:hypothetical protein
MDVVRKIESNKTDGRDKPVKEVIKHFLFFPFGFAFYEVSDGPFCV